MFNCNHEYIKNHKVTVFIKPDEYETQTEDTFKPIFIGSGEGSENKGNTVDVSSARELILIKDINEIIKERGDGLLLGIKED